jgi:hypothetical protein
MDGGEWRMDAANSGPAEATHDHQAIRRTTLQEDRKRE